MKKLLSLILLLSVTVALPFQAEAQRQTENLVIVTLDGYRWQEVFTGADKALINNEEFTDDPETLMEKFGADTPRQRREILMPFLWNVVAKKGQIYGNRELGNNVNVANKYWFSYPGYSEIFTGYPDERVDSNSYPSNPNTNVLGFINKQPEFEGKVVAFGSWNAFSRILNEERSDFPVNSGYELVTENLNGEPLTETQKMLNDYQRHTPRFIGSERLDASTFAMAFEYLKVNKPRVLYIGFGDTDVFAHRGKYGMYLNAAHYTDAMIKKLWDYLQSTPQYKNKTTLLITVDHGRGYGTEWTSHGSSVDHTSDIWFAVMGPDTPSTGVMSDENQLYQKQFAQTMAYFLGLTFEADHPVADRIESVIE